MNKKTYIVVGIIVLIAALGTIKYISKTPASQAAMDAFAKCLADKGAVMYGAYGCPHCQNEKKAFGDSFRFIHYVECPDNPNECMTRGITGYPTWTFPDGRHLEGEQGLKKLSEASGCTLLAL